MAHPPGEPYVVVTWPYGSFECRGVMPPALVRGGPMRAFARDARPAGTSDGAGDARGRRRGAVRALAAVDLVPQPAQLAVGVVDDRGGAVQHHGGPGGEVVRRPGQALVAGVAGAGDLRPGQDRRRRDRVGTLVEAADEDVDAGAR